MQHDLRRAAVKQEAAIPAEQIERAVTDYCAEAASNLANFADDRWRELLRTIIQTIIFHGDRITIQGRIPVETPGGNAGPTLYTVDVTGRNEQLLKTPSYASDPSWSPLLQ